MFDAPYDTEAGCVRTPIWTRLSFVERVIDEAVNRSFLGIMRRKQVFTLFVMSSFMTANRFA